MNSGKNLTCFKAYDVRGKLGEELNEDIAYRIGRVTAQSQNAKTVAVGFDGRATSPSLADAVAKGICDAGADVLDIGLAGTEEVYASVLEFGACAGIEVTASHNPIDYNGMKIVGRGSKPLSDQEFRFIKDLAEESNFDQPEKEGIVINKKEAARAAYVEKVIGFVDYQSLKPLKMVINSGNGAAGPTLDEISKKLKEKGVKTNFVFLHHISNPSFPNGIPNPLLEENRSSTVDAVVAERAHFGVAFDGDFDRCFFFDHSGDFIPGEYVVGLLAEVFLNKEKGATIIHDPRVIWNTIDVVGKCGGQAVASKTGHAFVKAAMRKRDAIYGGEMSAHHYFRDFAYCDSGIIPWLLVWEYLSTSNLSLSDLISEQRNRFPSSGELNFTVSDAAKCIERVQNHFASSAASIDQLDGLSVSFDTWRFNLRKSNTEPLVRLNIETRGDIGLLQEKINELKLLF
ncbi:phosphomannomutase [Rhodobacteraceae bacterium]|nr:phosphomannomutase [Paracoccaceae bacterium]